MRFQDNQIDEWRRRLERFGVRELDYARYDRIEPHDATFEFSKDGRVGAILLPLDPDSPNDDACVAFDLDRPQRWWTRPDGAPLLNPAAVERAAYYREPLKIWSTPLSWLRAGGQGIVALSRVDWRFWLAGIPTIEVEDLALGERIERDLRRPSSFPKILVKT